MIWQSTVLAASNSSSFLHHFLSFPKSFLLLYSFPFSFPISSTRLFHFSLYPCFPPSFFLFPLFSPFVFLHFGLPSQASGGVSYSRPSMLCLLAHHRYVFKFVTVSYPHRKKVEGKWYLHTSESSLTCTKDGGIWRTLCTLGYEKKKRFMRIASVSWLMEYKFFLFRQDSSLVEIQKVRNGCIQDER